MKKLGVVAIVVVGLLTLAQAVALIRLPITAVMMGRDPRFPVVLAFVLSLLPLTGSLVLGALLISNRLPLAEKWFQDADVGISLDAVSLLRLGLIIIGLTLITDAIPLALKSVTDSIIQAAQESLVPPLFGLVHQALWGLLQGLVLPVVEIGIGLLLIARSQSLANYLWADRPLGEPAVGLPQCPACGTPFDPADYQDGMTIARCSACKEPLDVGRA